MKQQKNPFLVSSYEGPQWFCNRVDETEALLNSLRNGRHVLLTSIRRMGKTALIRHVFGTVQSKESVCIYCDLQATSQRKELIKMLATSLWLAAPKHQRWGVQLINMIKKLRPVITFNELTGQPEISLTTANDAQEESSIKELFEMLKVLNKPVYIALDEFQQVSYYPEKNTEALLRSIIQSLSGITFVFAGSQQHLLNEMFNSAKRPFYGITQQMQLQPIQENEYGEFILHHFAENGIEVTPDALHYILSWTNCHTFYTQHLCNRLFGNILGNTITIGDVKNSCIQVLKEYDHNFLSLKEILSAHQWKLLKAIALSQHVYTPMAGEFITGYSLGSASAVSRSLESLIDKQLIYAGFNQDGKRYYTVYDVYLLRWLQQQVKI